MLARYKRRGADVHAAVAALSFIAALATTAPLSLWLLASFGMNTLALIANVMAWHP